MSKALLATGVAGYIGATFSYEAMKMGHRVIGIDNFISNERDNVNTLNQCFPDLFNFYELDISENKNDLRNIFKNYNPEIVIHFAGLKSVSESLEKPDLYWKNNVVAATNLIDILKDFPANIVFSSSATIYGGGVNEDEPFNENSSLSLDSPYGLTKYIQEILFSELSKSTKMNAVSLRYFNPVACHAEQKIIENLNQPSTNLLPNILKSALGEQKLCIYGNDFSTGDGTAERDFIHISDLISAHLKAMEYLDKKRGYDVFNIGTGIKISVLEFIQAFEKYNKLTLDYSFEGRREGDMQSCFADPAYANDELGWKAKKNLKDICVDSWQGAKKIKKC